MDYGPFSSLSEISEVEKTAVVVHAETSREYRLEALRCVVGLAQVLYDVAYYQRNEAGAWVRYLNFPSIRENSADNALNAALAYVNDRPQPGAPHLVKMWESNKPAQVLVPSTANRMDEHSPSPATGP